MPPTFQVLRALRASLAVSLGICGALYVPFTWHWPLVGDASLIHYIAFLIARGWAPYRQLGDMNMPGSFLIELGAMHLYGPGALAWRLFDFSVCLAGMSAIFAICSRRRWFAALFASSLFVLIHGRDGLAQGGQRDLTMAVLLLTATACLLRAERRQHLTALIGFGLLSGLAATIKPTSFLLTAAQLIILCTTARGERDEGRSERRRRQELIVGAITWLLAPAACLVFLLREHALRGFLEGLNGIVPYYQGLGHRSLGYVLVHSLSPILPLAAAWLLLLLLQRPSPRVYLDLRRRLLLAGVLFGIANCIIQHRALPYYRYPLLAFLLPLLALDFVEAAGFSVHHPGSSVESHQRGTRSSRPRQLACGLALAALSSGALFLAPQSAVLIHRYRWWQTDMLDSLERDLTALGGAALSRRVQCIDSVSGCGTVLYRMGVEPATGVLSDFLLFGNTTDPRPPENIPIIRQTRAELLRASAIQPPEVVVVTSHLHMSGPEGFGKLQRWPAFEEILAHRYRLETEWRPTRPERWWSREEYPASYRIYVLKEGYTGSR